MRFDVRILPQVSDTNMFGRVDYLAIQRWFDRARTPFYEELFPGFQFKPDGLVVVNMKVDYRREIILGDKIEIRTWTSRIGRKSFEMTQEAWRQRDGEPNPTRAAVSVCVFCAMDFRVHKSEPLGERLRAVLQKYLAEPGTTGVGKRQNGEECVTVRSKG